MKFLFLVLLGHAAAFGGHGGWFYGAGFHYRVPNPKVGVIDYIKKWFTPISSTRCQTDTDWFGWLSVKPTCNLALEIVPDNSTDEKSHFKSFRILSNVSKVEVARKGPKLPTYAAAVKRFNPIIRKILDDKIRNKPIASPSRLHVNKTTSDNFVAECPVKIDAFLELGDYAFIFEGANLYVLENGRLNETFTISEVFSGVERVNSSVFYRETGQILLTHGRTIYAFDMREEVFKMVKGFPRELGKSINFTPKGAFTWINGDAYLVDDTRYALYDIYGNTWVALGDLKNLEVFKKLPPRVRGFSDWDGGKAVIFTKNTVYVHNPREGTTKEETALNDYLGCFLVEFPNS